MSTHFETSLPPSSIAMIPTRFVRHLAARDGNRISRRLRKFGGNSERVIREVRLESPRPVDLDRTRGGTYSTSNNLMANVVSVAPVAPVCTKRCGLSLLRPTQGLIAESAGQNSPCQAGDA